MEDIKIEIEEIENGYLVTVRNSYKHLFYKQSFFENIPKTMEFVQKTLMEA